MKVGSISAILGGQETAEIQIDQGVDVQPSTTLFIGDKQTNCEVKVKKQTTKIFLVDLSSCNNSTVYSVNSDAFVYSEDYSDQEPTSPTQVAPVQPTELVKLEKVQFTNFGGGLRTNQSLIFDDLRISDGTTSEVSDLKYESDTPSFFLDFNHINAKQNSWGWMVGLSYWTVEWDEASGFGETLNLNNTESSILNFYGSGVYRFNSGFVQFGLNASSISSKNSPFLEASKGSLGAQLGGGFFVSENVMLAIESRAISYGTITYTQGSTSLVADNAGFYSGLNLALYFTLN